MDKMEQYRSDLQKAAEPLVAFLRARYHPHVKAIVESDWVTVLELVGSARHSVSYNAEEYHESQSTGTPAS